jgi:UDP-N-acetylmuramate: L-alanyl-gamma-D-glutamyl-meso-diaminopimelate ligase
MDPARNRIPEHVQTIHLMAVCGTAMGAVAVMLKELGYTVTGSDENTYPPMSTFLTLKGVLISEGFNAKNLAYHPDLVIVGNAISRDNPEAVYLARTGLNYCSMPQAVSHFIIKNKEVLLVTGTHGKTSTASLLAWVLHHLGYDPSYLIGGILNNFDSNFRLGKGPYVVLEGDEYDTAFFDKGPKFLHYDAATTILTGIEFDHADIYRDLTHVKETFKGKIARLKASETLIAYDTDPNIDAVIDATQAMVQRYGEKKSSMWHMQNRKIDGFGMSFDLIFKNQFMGRYHSPLPGNHNLTNTLAVIAAVASVGIDIRLMNPALTSFKGVKRRQEIRGVAKGITIVDDFAHHPTAVTATIEALKPHASNRLVAVFEPRTHSSMRKVFQDAYARAFDAADLVLIRKPSALEKVPPDERMSAKKLVKQLIKRGSLTRYFETTEEIIDFVVREGRSGDLVLIMSNGGFDNIHQRLIDRLNRVSGSSK